MSYSIIFTIKNRCGIILIVKKLATFTTAALLAVSLMGGGASANAADGGTIYPEDEKFIKVLAFDSLGDYAVDGEKYAFADGKSVKVYENGEYFEYAFGDAVTKVDISEGEIFAQCGEKTYTVLSQTEAEHAFPVAPYPVTCGNFVYSFDKNGGLVAYDMGEVATYQLGTGFENLKTYNDRVFAVNDNSLYELNGSEKNQISLEYADYSETSQIYIGQASVALKTYRPANFVQIAEGAFMTAVDLETVSGQYFVPLKTVRAKENTTALLLCYTGNAAVVSIGESSYILLKSKTSETEIEYSTEKPFETAQMTNNMIYASPFVTGGTACYNSAMSMVVTVLARLECADVLDTPFYEVEYEVAGMKARGYVTEGFLTPYIAEDNKKPEEVRDPEYSENSDTKTILIIFAVVVLVLAVLAYVVHLSSNKKNKKNKKKDKNKEE